MNGGREEGVKAGGRDGRREGKEGGGGRGERGCKRVREGCR